MVVFAAGFAELIILLIMLVGPLIKAFFDYLAEQKKRQEVKNLGAKIVQAAQENNEEIILAEPAEISYDLAETPVERKPTKEKKTPKVRSKSNRKKAEQAADAVFETSATPTVAPVVAATVSPATPYEKELPQQQESANDDSLAAVIFKMFQSPTGVQQAILVSEILKRPNVGTTGPGSVHNF